MLIKMSESLFTSVTKSSASLFSGISDSSTSRGGLFSSSNDKPSSVIIPGSSIFQRLAGPQPSSSGSLFPAAPSTSGNLFATPSTSGTLFPSATASSTSSTTVVSPPRESFRSPASPDSSARRRSLKLTIPSVPASASHRDPPTPCTRRRPSASSQISRKYVRLQRTASVKSHRGSDEQEASATSPEAGTTDLRLNNVPADVNSCDKLREHLKQFGKVRRTFPNKKKASAVVHFSSIAEASTARQRIPTIPEFTGVSVFFSNLRSGRAAAISLPSPPLSLSLKRHQPPALPPVPSAMPAKVAKLDGLQRMVGRSAAERLDVLKQRDDFVRQSLGRMDLSKLPGVCPDMCPERERYARQEQHRLSVFEIVPGSHPSQVDHSRAVKEYARSSADQPPPLPLDMRPMPVLTRTMEYLVAEVADRCEESGAEKITWGEWYDFLWNRTRAIRKEITQQRFCSVATAQIVEQIARFHIFAAVRLCGLPIDEFDPKINDENLTKCLQTLKELYHDLELAGAASPNEAEFRGYMILRNLNDTNLLNEVTQLAPHIRTSDAVRLAMKAYFDLSDNNYVHFFKLVRRASFLEAALLHRYFPQVRRKALQVMVRSYTPPGKGGNITLFPLAALTSQLGFEDEQEAVEFCEAFGLRHNDAFVIFSRTAFQLSSDPPSGRAQLLIRAKLGDRRIGEILKGGPVTSPFPLQAPKSSFDAEGKFVASASDCLKLATKIETEAAPQKVEEEEEEDEDEEDVHEEESYDDKYIPEVEKHDDDDDDDDEEEEEEEEEIDEEEVENDDSKETFEDEELEEGEIVEEEEEEARCRGGLKSAVVVKKEVKASPDSEVSSRISTLSIQDVSSDILGEVIKAMISSDAVVTLEREKIHQSLVTELQDDLLHEVVQSRIREEAKSAIQNEKAAMEAAAQTVCENLVASFVLSEGRTIAQTVLSEAIAHENVVTSEQTGVIDGLVSELAREAAMAELAACRWAVAAKRKFLARWRHAMRLRLLRRSDKALLQMPAGPPLEHSRRIADRLLGTGRPPLTDPALCDFTAHDRVIRAMERKQRRLQAPFQPADFPAPSGERDRLLLLLGQPGVALEVAEFVLAKFDQLDFVEPWILGPEAGAAPCRKSRVAAIICLGCAPPESHRQLPLLRITDREEEERVALPKARNLLLNSTESPRAAWSEALASGLRWCLAQSARSDEEGPPLALMAFLETFLSHAFFRPLSDLTEQLRLDDRLPVGINALLDFYTAVLSVLEAEVPADVSYRILPLLKIDRFPALREAAEWETGVTTVQRFMSGQHFSEQCAANCQAVVRAARRHFRAAARDWDLERWIEPPLSVLPWDRLLLHWVEDRLAEVGRQCASVLRDCRASPRALQRCLEAATAAATCGLPSSATAAPLDSALAPALEKARVLKWNAFCTSFGVDKEGGTERQKSARDQEWEELERELQKLRSAVKDQLNDSLHISDLFHA